MTFRPLRPVVAIAAFLLPVSALAACEQSRPAEESVLAAAPDRMASRGAAPASEMEIRQQQGPTIEPRFIRNGSLRLEVELLEAAIEAATGIAEAAEGFVAESEQREGAEGARRGSMLLRVPSESLQDVITDVSTLGDVLSVSVTSTDISREYFDLETRLAVKRETVARLQALMERSGDLQDLLAVERELGRATEELESLEGQVRYYDQRVALSDLRVTLIEPGAVLTTGAFYPIVEAIRDSARVFAESAAELLRLVVRALPWLILAILGWIALRRFVFTGRGKKEEAEEAP